MYNTKSRPEIVYAALSRSWGQDTVRRQDRPGWSQDNPCYGQCCVTALVLNSILGYKVYSCSMVDWQGNPVEGLHYFNKDPNGEICDLTADQFSHISVKPAYSTGKRVNPKMPMRKKNVRDRFGILEERVKAEIARMSDD